MDMEELKARRLQGQYLCENADAKEVCANLLGLQAQFLSAGLHALRIRTGSSNVTGLTKTWTLRGTVHLIPEDDLGLYIRTCGGAEDVVHSAWYGWQASRGHALPEKREIHLAKLLLEGVRRGVDRREELRLLLRENGMTMQEEASAFNGWGGLIAELAQVGALCFKVQQEKAYRLCPPFTPMEEHDAHREMLRRYLTHYGPVTLRDAAYFFRAAQKDVKAWMEDVPVQHAVCEGRTYFYIPQNMGVRQAKPCIFLAGFDQVMLGYRKEDNPFLPAEHLRRIFNLAGIVAPAVLLNGRVAGKWKQEKNRLDVTMFEALSAAERTLVEEEARSLWPGLQHLRLTQL